MNYAALQHKSAALGGDRAGQAFPIRAGRPLREKTDLKQIGGSEVAYGFPTSGSE